MLSGTFAFLPSQGFRIEMCLGGVPLALLDSFSIDDHPSIERLHSSADGAAGKRFLGHFIPTLAQWFYPLRVGFAIAINDNHNRIELLFPGFAQCLLDLPGILVAAPRRMGDRLKQTAEVNDICPALTKPMDKLR